jgi:integral membrane sensor domain MASE1
MMQNAEKSKMPPLVWAIVFAVACSPIMLLLQHFGRSELMLPTFCILGTLAVTVKVCWDMHSRQWFWPAILILSVLNSLLVVLPPWHSGWIPAPLILVGCIIDLVLMLAVLSLLEKSSHSTLANKDK